MGPQARLHVPDGDPPVKRRQARPEGRGGVALHQDQVGAPRRQDFIDPRDHLGQ